VVLSPENAISADTLPKSITRPSAAQTPGFSMENGSLKQMVEGYEKEIILAALEKTNGNQKKAARLLSVNATTLSEKLKRYNIRNLYLS